ncbi:hypothetical protein GCM10025876_40620 [Demequina litorisediminis]|uniref:Uncharacterized protein n=2 Tax=Demequina litorisediminis TaxID=1849022 RepID=A0ABQ6IL02_9MICO|nr:hypothetical protein GCM10025876_40030 [Demequina litorisediminis]GMA37858.1 hypothetical protein GCM10025876_40620 [Demequina litorisediminis]
MSRTSRDKVALEVTQLRPELMRVKGLTFKALRAAIREFVDAGYDATDIVHMLDWTPRNEARPHSGLYGIVHGTAWIARVFDPWRDSHGTPLASPGARRRAAEHRRRNAAAERAAQREHERIQAPPRTGNSPRGLRPRLLPRLRAAGAFKGARS